MKDEKMINDAPATAFVADLLQRHPDHTAETWDRYEALYRGGDFFRARIGGFLPQNPMEPADVYDHRKRAARYRGYVGPIVDQFAAQLFAAPLTVRARDESGDSVEPDPFFARFKEDVDGVGTDLVDFARDGFRDALIKRSSWWLASLPSAGEAPPQNLAEWQERGLGEARLSRLAAECVLDWECDEAGELLWAIVYEERRPRAGVRAARTQVEARWRVFDRTGVELFVAYYDARDGFDGKAVAVSRGHVPHGFDRVPLVRLTMPEGLWLANRLADAQIEHFQLSAGLSWAMRRTCYAMPVFKLADERAPPTMGIGYFLQIGKDDEMAWVAPPSQPFEVVQAEIKAQKDEIYRVALQMAHGVDNNAAAVGRSGESKRADASATEVCLQAYGAIVREAIERVYDLVATGRGDRTRFSVEGLDRFSLGDASDAIENATSAAHLDIPSPTFRKELMVQTAEALLPRVDQAKKDAIRREIESGVELRKRQHDEHEALESAMLHEMGRARPLAAA